MRTKTVWDVFNHQRGVYTIEPLYHTRTELLRKDDHFQSFTGIQFFRVVLFELYLHSEARIDVRFRSGILRPAQLMYVFADLPIADVHVCWSN